MQKRRKRCRISHLYSSEGHNLHYIYEKGCSCSCFKIEIINQSLDHGTPKNTNVKFFRLVIWNEMQFYICTFPAARLRQWIRLCVIKFHIFHIVKTSPFYFQNKNYSPMIRALIASCDNETSKKTSERLIKKNSTRKWNIFMRSHSRRVFYGFRFWLTHFQLIFFSLCLTLFMHRFFMLKTASLRFLRCKQTRTQ